MALHIEASSSFLLTQGLKRIFEVIVSVKFLEEDVFKATPKDA